MVTLAVSVTPFVLTVTVARFLPELILTVAGTVASAVLLLESETTCPLLGAFVLSLTVAVTLLPPGTVVDDGEMEEGLAASTPGAQRAAATRSARMAPTMLNRFMMSALWRRRDPAR